MLPRMPSFRLDGRRALVTGAGRGLGVASAAALAQASAHVTLCARSRDEIEEIAQAIRDDGGVADALVLDVTDVTGPTRPWRNAPPSTSWSTMRGPISLALRRSVKPGFRCRHGAQFAGRLLRGTGGRARHDGCGTWWLDHSHVLPDGSCGWAKPDDLLRVQGWDRRPLKSDGDRSCATQYPRQHHRTDIHRDAVDEAFSRRSRFSERRSQQDQARAAGRVEDIMGAVVFLASDAAALITGVAILVDGGWTAD